MVDTCALSDNRSEDGDGDGDGDGDTLVTDSQRVTWTAFAILAMFSVLNTKLKLTEDRKLQ